MFILLGHPVVRYHARRRHGGDHKVYARPQAYPCEQGRADPGGYPSVLRVCREGGLEDGHLV